MKTKDYILLGSIFLLISLSNNWFNKEESMSELFEMILEREDSYRDSLRSQDIKIADLSSQKEKKEYNYYYANNRAEKFLDKPTEITKADTSNCLPIINSLFECKDIYKTCIMGYLYASFVF